MTPVLFLDHASALGGAEYNLLFLLKHLARTRWQPHLLCTPGQLAEKARDLGIPVHLSPYPRLRRSSRFFFNWLTEARHIARLARGIEARAIYANTVRAAVYAAPAAHLARMPFLWHMQDFWLSESRPRYLWADRLGKWGLVSAAKRVLVNSQAVATHLPQSKKISVVYYTIETERFDPALDGQSFRAQFGVPRDAPIVGMAGRLRPWKGQARFLRAMARVAAALPEARFLIVGGEIFGLGDAYEQEIHQLADSLGLAERAIFTGQLEDVRPALAAMDVFVHPGDPEPFGLVNIEAMAMGKPVVAFGHGALPEIVVDGETGLLASPGDEAALAERVLSLLHDPLRREAMGRAGRRRVEQHFSGQRMAAEIDTLLTEVVG